MKTSSFDYDLPPELIAQEPLKERDMSRLMVVERSSGRFSHHIFREIVDFLESGDCLVVNTSRVFPARLRAVKSGTGGKVELLLLERTSEGTWVAMVGGARLRPGTELEFPGKPLSARIERIVEPGKALVVFECTGGSGQVDEVVRSCGEVPLPPYIKKKLDDPELYQTVYSQREISSAAPTAGLHFTRELLSRIEEKGVRVVGIELAVSADTFAPMREEDVDKHRMHSEWFSVGEECADAVNSCGGKVVAVGTTTVRALESAALIARMPEDGSVKPGERKKDAESGRRIIPFTGRTDLFIRPGHDFLAVDGILTNFHFPRSTLLMLVCAFGGSELVLAAYREAVKKRYRFYSFGDAMLII